MLGTRHLQTTAYHPAANVIVEQFYGQTIRLPAEFFAESKANDGNNIEPADMGKQLQDVFKKIRPTEGSRHETQKTFMFKDLNTASHVFVRLDQVKTSLQNPLQGPFPVISRNNKTYVVRIRGKDTHVSIDRLKPAYIIDSESDSGCTQEEVPSRITRESATQGPINTQIQVRTRSS
ncbi:hypothetical protein WN51_07924 [Melipona quadrifasciata]|uniref:Uncharacterized protein n=1 Tax=Melipona quadrifasciata TaxID=166423 RepID=A0A0M8ZRV7_9HYME|nr:hypothetical protein WN51_07924 [Melipona quadrifasciata]